MVNYTDIIKSRKHNPIIDKSVDFMMVSTPTSKLNEHKLNKGDLVFLPSSETCEDLGVSSLIDFDEDDIVFSYHILRFQFNREINHYFKKYLGNYHSVLCQFSSEGKGTTRQIIGRNVFRNVWVVIPPLSEQIQIVQFLDEKTELIDRLISTKERKIDLLKQQRTSLINEVITKGLNPDVKMKDSFVDWIGIIPEHWGIIKLKYVGGICSGDTLQSDKINTEGLFPVYGGNGIMGYYTHFNYFHPVLSIGRVGEKCGNVHLVSQKCWINDNSLVLDNTNENIDLFYLFYSLTTRDLNVIRNQNTQPLITGTMVKNEYIPFPPISEQQQIVEHLDIRTKEIDELVSTEQKKIDLLKEYRQSLISEVITGKIDVRN
jgi:type I restriction enzyme S subunit